MVQLDLFSCKMELNNIVLAIQLDFRRLIVAHCQFVYNAA